MFGHRKRYTYFFSFCHSFYRKQGNHGEHFWFAVCCISDTDIIPGNPACKIKNIFINIIQHELEMHYSHFCLWFAPEVWPKHFLENHLVIIMKCCLNDPSSTPTVSQLIIYYDSGSSKLYDHSENPNKPQN